MEVFCYFSMLYFALFKFISALHHFDLLAKAKILLLKFKVTQAIGIHHHRHRRQSHRGRGNNRI